jgi:hypothetical protein
LWPQRAMTCLAWCIPRCSFDFFIICLRSNIYLSFILMNFLSFCQPFSCFRYFHFSVIKLN